MNKIDPIAEKEFEHVIMDDNFINTYSVFMRICAIGGFFSFHVLLCTFVFRLSWSQIYAVEVSMIVTLLLYILYNYTRKFVKII